MQWEVVTIPILLLPILGGAVLGIGIARQSRAIRRAGVLLVAITAFTYAFAAGWDVRGYGPISIAFLGLGGAAGSVAFSGFGLLSALWINRAYQRSPRRAGAYLLAVFFAVSVFILLIAAKPGALFFWVLITTARVAPIVFGVGVGVLIERRSRVAPGYGVALIAGGLAAVALMFFLPIGFALGEVLFPLAAFAFGTGLGISGSQLHRQQSRLAYRFGVLLVIWLIGMADLWIPYVYLLHLGIPLLGIALWAAETDRSWGHPSVRWWTTTLVGSVGAFLTGWALTGFYPFFFPPRFGIREDPVAAFENLAFVVVVLPVLASSFVAGIIGTKTAGRAMLIAAGTVAAVALAYLLLPGGSDHSLIRDTLGFEGLMASTITIAVLAAWLLRPEQREIPDAPSLPDGAPAHA
jgi:hypothetical protein